MAQKNYSCLSVGTVLIAVIVLLGVCAMLFSGRLSFFGQEQNKMAAQTNRIHGQVMFDQRIALPPQAMLSVQLTARERTTNSVKVVSEVREKITDQVPVDFSLPVMASELDSDYAYTLQAKISVGDTLWFVNEAGTPVDPERSGYLLRLTAVDRNNSDTDSPNRIRGKQWAAEDIFNNGIVDDTHITLYIDNKAKTDPSTVDNHYHVNGSGGCNRYLTTATLNEKDNKLRFEALGMTFMACAEAISLQEAQFIDMMAKVRAYRLNQAGFLYLLDENNNTLARFAPQD